MTTATYRKLKREIKKELLEELGLEIGKKSKTVIVKPLIGVDRELIYWTKKFVDKYRPALKALAKK